MKYIDSIKNVMGISALGTMYHSTGYNDEMFIIATVFALLWVVLHSYVNIQQNDSEKNNESKVEKMNDEVLNSIKALQDVIEKQVSENTSHISVMSKEIVRVVIDLKNSIEGSFNEISIKATSSLDLGVGKLEKQLEFIGNSANKSGEEIVDKLQNINTSISNSSSNTKEVIETSISSLRNTIKESLYDVNTKMIKSIDFRVGELEKSTIETLLSVKTSINETSSNTNEVIENNIISLNNTIKVGTDSLHEINKEIIANHNIEIIHLRKIDTFKESTDRVADISILLSTATERSIVEQKSIISKMSYIVESQKRLIDANDSFNESFLDTLNKTRDNQDVITNSVEKFEDKVEVLANELKNNSIEVFEKVGEILDDLKDLQSEGITDLNEEVIEIIDKSITQLSEMVIDKYSEVSSLVVGMEDRSEKLLVKQNELFINMNDYLKNNVSELQKIPNSLVNGLDEKNKDFKKSYTDMFNHLQGQTIEMKNILKKVSTLHENIEGMNKNDYELIKKYL